ncbi:MAG: hypothetical protein EXR71_06735 [Myxococcales bacterium]|nr:hypothetical protein [Myxococcales bacterium]
MLDLFLLLTGCLGPSTDTAEVDSEDDSDTAGDTAGDTGNDLAAWCATEGFGSHHPWNADGPYGELRHDLADDFSVPLTDGTTWTLSERWTGCENAVFIPDDIVRTVSAADSIWSKDLDDLIAGSPRNTHYFFVSVDTGDIGDANREALLTQRDKQLGRLEADEATWWADHLHVASVPAKDLDGWLKQVLRTGIGEGGLGIDRYQRLRGLGSFADNTRTDSSNSGWPFQNNMAFAALESRFFNMEATRQDALAAVVDPTLVQLWNGEVISEYADMVGELPTAAEMETFDTFEIDIDMRCPEPNEREQGNCGAWDYLANFYVQDDAGAWIELSRFITTYHREARWVADATPMLPHLLAGGSRTFRWSWAPSWNVQPTETRVQLRFSNQGKGVKPRSATLVATGGGFNSAYNDGREPVRVPVAGAAKVQLWAVTSGHGMEANNCAEFCNHQHEFSVDGSTHLQEFTTAGTATGCIDQIENQMTPNQSGTWWYGRGGWCPGQIVMPYAVDVTAEVGTDGEAVVGYRGMYRDQAPPPDGAGTIVLNAWLVTYE